MKAQLSSKTLLGFLINSVDDFIMKGKDLRHHLNKLHAERKVMVYSNKTVVFY
jgi:formyltetrahydrofolate deformylase